MGVTYDDRRGSFARGWRPRQGTPRLIVIHHSDTATPAQTFAALKAKGISTHFEVDKDGAVIRYLDPAKCVAYHAGRANGTSIGIDITHRSGQPWPDAQVAAAVALVQELAAQFGIPLVVAPDGARKVAPEWVMEGVGILRHRSLDATACPEDFPMGRLVQAQPPVNA